MSDDALLLNTPLRMTYSAFLPVGRNRRWFHNVEFFFLLFNTIVGSVSLALRFSKTIFYSVIFISRLDTTVMPKGQELNDAGHAVYVGFLLVDHYYGNPIMVTFVRCVLRLYSAVGAAGLLTTPISLLIEGRESYSGDVLTQTPSSCWQRLDRAKRAGYDASLLDNGGYYGRRRGKGVMS